MKTQKDRPTAATAGPKKKCSQTESSYHTELSLSSCSDKVERLKEDILACIAKRGRYTTFAELSKYVEGFNGEYQYNTKYPNVVLWAGVSKEAIEAVLRLYREDRIVLSPVSILVYIYEGRGLNVPVAERLRAYKKPHWLPMAMCRTYHPTNKRLSHGERVAELRKLIR